MAIDYGNVMSVTNYSSFKTHGVCHTALKLIIGSYFHIHHFEHCNKNGLWLKKEAVHAIIYLQDCTLIYYCYC